MVYFITADQKKVVGVLMKHHHFIIIIILFLYSNCTGQRFFCIHFCWWYFFMPCLGPLSIISVCLPLPLLPLRVLFVMIFSNTCLFIKQPKNNVSFLCSTFITLFPGTIISFWPSRVHSEYSQHSSKICHLIIYFGYPGQIQVIHNFHLKSAF